MGLTKKQIMKKYHSEIETQNRYLCHFFKNLQGEQGSEKFKLFLIRENILPSVRCGSTLMTIFNDVDDLPQLTFIFRVMVLEYYLAHELGLKE